MTVYIAGFRPLAGCGLFLSDPVLRGCSLPRFRPLAGCGLFPSLSVSSASTVRFRPLAGCGLFRFSCDNASGLAAVSVPLRGVGRFISGWETGTNYWFPSPCGVWVVSKGGNVI